MNPLQFPWISMYISEFSKWFTQTSDPSWWSNNVWCSFSAAYLGWKPSINSYLYQYCKQSCLFACWDLITSACIPYRDVQIKAGVRTGIVGIAAVVNWRDDISV